jgi:hypothetical protein
VVTLPGVFLACRRDSIALGCLRLSVVGVTLPTNANIALQCAYHVVWCPKYRRRVIGGRMEARLKDVIAEVIAE